MTSQPSTIRTVPPERTTATGERADEFVDSMYRAHAVELIRLALLLVGDQHTAEDVVQDAYLGLQGGLGRLRDTGKALPYLRASVVNGCRSVHRRRSRVSPHAAAPEPPPVWSAEAAVVAGEDRRAVLAAVAGLPERSREVLAFRYFLDLPDGEIAAALRVSRSTVSSTASRALVMLARKLEEQQ
ncbi:MAG TPA: sigma-70 family RNA polymerase sigma factor [Streptosporangiaceae bacterium]|nr:sigma-70 family RNA polymerase sigma factor [Streptosporangiaceae bacterium]